MADSASMNLGTEGQILYDANKKSKLVSYLLWLFLGWAGAHRFYNRHIKSGIAQLLSVIGGYAALAKAYLPVMHADGGYSQKVMEAAQKAASEGKELDPSALPPAPPELQAAYEGMLSDPFLYVGGALLAIYSIWWIVDAFLIPGWVRRHNEGLAASLRGR
jgi:hypothetical protein